MNKTNLDKIREKLDALKSGGGKKDFFWKPAEGESVVRILPTSDGDPFKQFHFHYNVGKERGFLCPRRNFDESCPVCEFATQLYRSEDEDNIKAAKEMFVRERYFSFIVVRGEEDKGIRLWGYGKRVYEKFLNYMLDPDYGDFTDLESGRDMKVTLSKGAGKSFPDTDVVLKPRETVAVEDVDSLMESMPDIMDSFERKSTADVQAILDAALTSSDDPEEASVESAHYGSDSDAPQDIKVDDLTAALAEASGKRAGKK